MRVKMTISESLVQGLSKLSLHAFSLRSGAGIVKRAISPSLLGKFNSGYGVPVG